jgi:hypothetical protein
MLFDGRRSFWSAEMTTFNVTFHYLGRDWFLSTKNSWTDQPSGASHYISREAAGAALVTARRYMRNKQVKARVVATPPTVEAPLFGRHIEQEGMFPIADGAAHPFVTGSLSYRLKKLARS